MAQTKEQIMAEAAAATGPGTSAFSFPQGAHQLPPEVREAMRKPNVGVGQGQQVSEVERTRIMADRQKMWDQQRAEGATADSDVWQGEDLPDDRDSRQELDSFEVTLPNGKTIVYGPPTGVSLDWDIASILGPQSMITTMNAMCRTALCVRMIDGKKVPRAGDLVSVRKIINALGDAGVDILYELHQQCWPPMLKKDLPQIQRIFRER